MQDYKPNQLRPSDHYITKESLTAKLYRIAPRWPWAILIVSLVILFVGIAAIGYALLHSSQDAEKMKTAQQSILDAQTALATAQDKQAKLDQQEVELLTAQADLKLSQDELATALVLLENQKAELSAKTIALDAAQTTLNEQMNAFLLQTSQLGSMVGVRSKIISELSATLSRYNMSATIDPVSGDIITDSSILIFETNKAELSPKSKQFLNAFVPLYLEVLMRPEYANYLESIIIEGHTDLSGSYKTNYQLSQERALEVLLYIRSMYENDSATLARLEKILVATGKGYTDPVYYNTSNGNQYIDPYASRRVEFKFSLRDAEMIEEMNKLLNGQ